MQTIFGRLNSGNTKKVFKCSKVRSDLFEYNGVHYLLWVDYCSKWIGVAKLDNLTSSNIIGHLKSQSIYGIPDEPISDNGRQYVSSAVTEFSNSWGFVRTTSSQMVKLKGQFRPLRISPREHKILIRHC